MFTVFKYMQITQPIQSSSYEDLLAANFDRCLQEQRARRAAQEASPIHPYGWNEDTHTYHPTAEDQVDLQAELAIERNDYIAYCADSEF